jgi:ABC-type nickel/cobalt efflux system permease component RcnA
MPVDAHAHPLGNFTINHYTEVALRPDAIDVLHVVDMAEIPAFQERRAVDANGDGRIAIPESTTFTSSACRDVAAGLAITVGGAVIRLSPAAAGALAFPPGAGGLPTMRLECHLEGRTPLPEGTTVVIENTNDAGRLGWHEIVVAGDGVTLAAADAPTTSASARLTAYPDDLLRSPLDRRQATITVGPPGETAGGPAAQRAPTGGGRSSDRLTRALTGLVTRGTTSPWLWLLALAVASAIGGAHAIGPGHGKTLMAAYLVGSEARTRQVLVVGIGVALMHTTSVAVLGGAVLLAGRLFPPEAAVRWTSVASGTLVVALGSWLLVTRLRRHHTHAHDHPHERGTRGRVGLATLALSGGIVPSPSALVTLLAAVAIGRAAFGLALVTAFGLGLATVLVAIGFGTIRLRDVVRQRLPHHAVSLVPPLGACAVLFTGIALTLRGLAAG